MLGSLISAGASLIGGLLGKSSADDAREAQERMAAQNIQLQKDFAQQGIQWRVADAKAAGIHPIYALGSGGASFTPVTSNFTSDTSLPNALASAGQDISRGITATQNRADRLDGFTKAAQALTLEKGGLENEILRMEIASKVARLQQGQVGPPMPVNQRYLIDGQGDTAVSAAVPVGSSRGAPGSSALVQENPMRRTPSDPRAPYSEPGAIQDVGPVRTSAGIAHVPSKDVKERIEDNFLYEMQHFFRNQVLPAVSMSSQQNMTKGFPPAPPGHHWHFIPMRGEYQLVKDNESYWQRLRRNWQ